MALLTMMVGVPGSGKSTYVLSETAGGTDNLFVYSTDAYLEQVARKHGRTYDEVFAEHFPAASAHMNARLTVALQQGKDVIWDQTLTSSRRRRQVLAMFDGRYRKACIVFLPPCNDVEAVELARRLSNRPGKTIPAQVIVDMVRRFEAPTVSEGFQHLEIKTIFGASAA